MLNFHPLLANIETEVRIKAHVLVGHPDQGETAHQVPAPVLVQQLVASNGEKNDNHVVAEAVLTAEDEEELPGDEVLVVLTLVDAIFARLAKYFFVRYRPGNTGNRDGQHKKPYNLQVKRHYFKDAAGQGKSAFGGRRRGTI